MRSSLTLFDQTKTYCPCHTRIVSFAGLSSKFIVISRCTPHAIPKDFLLFLSIGSKTSLLKFSWTFTAYGMHIFEGSCSAHAFHSIVGFLRFHLEAYCVFSLCVVHFIQHSSSYPFPHTIAFVETVSKIAAIFSLIDSPQSPVLYKFTDSSAVTCPVSF